MQEYPIGRYKKQVHSSLGVSVNNNTHTHTHIVTHAHTVLTVILPGEPGLAGCPINFLSPFIPRLLTIKKPEIQQH